MSTLPERIELESEGRRSAFVLRRDLYALHGWDGADEERAVTTMEEAGIAAFAGAPESGLPVYALDGGEELAFPTGAVWVRFAEGVDAKSRASDLERAGFRIDSVPGYAPNAAFVRSTDVAAALNRLDALRALRGVEKAEPQMLMKASRR